MLKAFFVAFAFCCLLIGCNQNIATDHSYQPSNYSIQLVKLGLTEIRPFPNLHEPFITVTKDGSGTEYAVLFFRSGTVKKVVLPLTMDEITSRFKSSGYKVSEDYHDLSIVWIKDQIYWLYQDADNKSIYMNSRGEIVKSPFE
jgi:hypothetical protein